LIFADVFVHAVEREFALAFDCVARFDCPPRPPLKLRHSNPDHLKRPLTRALDDPKLVA
jgi:hypothetical protein